MLEVSVGTVSDWELNLTAPYSRHISRIIEFLGYIPDVFPTGSLGERIALNRKLLGLTQADLAAKAGVHSDTVGCWERGVQWPQARQMRKLNKLFSGLPSGGLTL